MGDHLVLSVDPVVVAPAPASVQPPTGSLNSQTADLPASAIPVNGVGKCDIMEAEEKEVEEEEEEEGKGEGDHLIQKAECRICQLEDSLQNLEIPCACSGSLKFAHRRCVKLWCFEKGDTICEICHQPFEPGYTVLVALYHRDDTPIDINESWSMPRNPLDLQDPRVMAIAHMQHQVLEAEHDNDITNTGINVNTGNSGSTFSRFTVLILLVLLLLKYVAPFFSAGVEKALSHFFFFFYRAAAFFLPCYLMARSIRIIQYQRRRRQRQRRRQAEEQQGERFAISPAPAFR